MRHHFQEKLRAEVGPADCQVGTNQLQRLARQQPVRATHIRKDGGVVQDLSQFSDGPVAPAQKAPHVGALPDELARGSGSENHRHVVRVGEQLDHIVAAECAVRLGQDHQVGVAVIDAAQ